MSEMRAWRRSSALVPALACFAMILGASVPTSAVKPRGRPEYQLASIRGTYAFNYTFTALSSNDSAALGLAVFDGSGAISGVFVQNWPGRVCRLPRRTRCVAPGTTTGTYTVNADGTSRAFLRNAFSDQNPGETATELSFDGVVTRAKVVGSSKLAMEIFNIQSERPFVANIGGLASGIAKRLPDGADFAPASLRGTYAVTSITGAIPAGTLGLATFDGRGNVSSTLTVNLRAARANRQVIRGITGVGTYSVSSMGNGEMAMKITLPDGSSPGASTFDFVVTEAHVVGSRTGATEIFAIQREPGTLSKRLVAWVFKRLPD